MPNTEVITQWVEALESGGYPQTVGTLHRVKSNEGDPPVGFCCLGVLCDLAVKAGVIPEPEILEYTSTSVMTYVGNNRDGLPEAVRDWAGLNSDPEVDFLHEEPDFGTEEIAEPLSMINDSYGKTFPEIADIIRDNYLRRLA